MVAVGRYELGEDGVWLDLSRPTNFDKDEELRTFATAEDYEVMEYIATLEAQLAEREGEVEQLRWVANELIEVAELRGDNALPLPEDDPLLWTARMQTAWNELEEALTPAPKPEGEEKTDG